MSDDEPIQKALMETIRKKFLCIHLKELLGECGATKGGKREVMMLRVNDVLAGKCIQYGVVQRRQALEIALDYCARKFDVVIAGGASGGDTLKNLCAESEKAETVSLGDTDGRDRCDAPQPKAVLSEAQALLFKRIETSDPFYVDVYDKELFSSQSALLSDMPVLSPTQLEKQVQFAYPPNHVMQMVECVFMLTALQAKRVREDGYALQCACVLHDDEVNDRLHWPYNADLRVNRYTVNVPSRSHQFKMGRSVRDSAASIGLLCREGLNRLYLAGIDTRKFSIAVRLVRKRTVDEMLALTITQTASFGDSMQRVLSITKSVGGAADDDDLIFESADRLVLRCPLSGERIACPARYAQCKGLRCFDLTAFLTLAEQSRKWQCPAACACVGPVTELRIDPWIYGIVNQLAAEGRVDDEVEFNSEGQWRVIEKDAPWRDPPCAVLGGLARFPQPIAAVGNVGGTGLKRKAELQPMRPASRAKNSIIDLTVDAENPATLPSADLLAFVEQAEKAAENAVSQAAARVLDAMAVEAAAVVNREKLERDITLLRREQAEAYAAARAGGGSTSSNVSHKVSRAPSSPGGDLHSGRMLVAQQWGGGQQLADGAVDQLRTTTPEVLPN